MRLPSVALVCPIFLAACQRQPMPAPAVGDACPHFRALAGKQDGQHDFDFEFGSWKAHLSRRLHPLTGSATWVDYDGTSVVRKIWAGRANLGELEVEGAGGHIEGITLRLYDPQSREWNVRFASSADGALTPALIGGFHDERGEFFDHEELDGRPICVRFVFSEITATSFRFEQAFSGDDGKTWEVNWISTFTRTDR
jgi:hypothetical protein